MERDVNPSERVNLFKDFNSHAHVERDQTLLSARPKRAISTHTLTWSVTIYGCFKDVDTADFNSHAHVERDVQQKYFKTY